jgi:hypothetical protein
MEIFHKAFFVFMNSIFLAIINFYIIILDTKYLGVVISMIMSNMTKRHYSYNRCKCLIIYLRENQIEIYFQINSKK